MADPLIVHWPQASRRGETRRQYVHAIDIVPTLLEILGVQAPPAVAGVPQSPIEGTSFASCLGDADASDRHVTQYYEMFGCRALYHDGWKAVTYHPIQGTRPGLRRRCLRSSTTWPGTPRNATTWPPSTPTSSRT